jgi:hypothetical protein
MNYELAKQLKDAGFPQGDYQSRVRLRQAFVNWESEHNPITEWFAMPPLSELIEACDTLIDLYGHGSQWGAETPKGLVVEGTTPEEAVARLWLALNPPK